MSISEAMSGRGMSFRIWLMITLVWLIFFVIGFPIPFVDDIYFIGPALNLVQHGTFFNPYCPGIQQVDPLPEYFVYTPVYGFILAGWLKVVGTGRVTLAAFQCLAGLAATAGIWQATRRYFRHWMYPLLTAFCLLIFTGACGLRPDALGLAFFAWGLLTLQTPTRGLWAFSLFCLLSAPLVSPNLAAISALVLAGTVWMGWRDLSQTEFFIRLGILVLLTALLTVIFLSMIDFQLRRFISVFLATRAMGAVAVNGFRYNLEHFYTGDVRAGLRILFQTIAPTLAVVFMLAVYLCRRGWFLVKISWELVMGLAVTLAALYVAALSSATGSRLISCFSILVLLFLMGCLRLPFRRWGQAGWALFGVVYLFTSGSHTLQLALLPFSGTRVQAQELRAVIARTNAVSIYVDSFAAALLYDYRLPPNVKNMDFGSPSKFFTADSGDFPPGSLLVFSKEGHSISTGEVLYSGDQEKKMILIGSMFPDLQGNPYNCVVVQVPDQP